LSEIIQAEKGYKTVELSVETEGGHSSMPARETPIGILSAGLAKLESNPMPATLKTFKETLRYIATGYFIF
jgi:carboxypeptidase PM20D1